MPGKLPFVDVNAQTTNELPLLQQRAIRKSVQIPVVQLCKTTLEVFVKIHSMHDHTADPLRVSGNSPEIATCTTPRV